MHSCPAQRVCTGDRGGVRRARAACRGEGTRKIDSESCTIPTRKGGPEGGRGGRGVEGIAPTTRKIDSENRL